MSGALKRVGSSLLAALLLCTTLAATIEGGSTAQAVALPVKQDAQAGVTVLSNAKATVDASNLAEGYLVVKYTGGNKVRIKVRITKTGGIAYDYDLNNAGTNETFPLTEGNGAYSIQVFENTTGTKYVQAYACSVNLALRNEYLPFLYSNQFVSFTADSKTVAKAAELVNGKTTELDKVTAIFTYAVDNLTYDYDLAKEVTANKKVGYLPVVDNVLAAKKGICLDYAALMSAMLRSQGIPCKLVVGFSGTIYHAWVNIYISGVGWVDKVIYFDGTKWTLMDPTFTSSGARSKEIMKYVTNSANYVQSFAY